ncbi:hypothetical protein CRYUN_Cryun15aG0006300 [Craigia yunnanensis]
MGTKISEPLILDKKNIDDGSVESERVLEWKDQITIRGLVVSALGFGTYLIAMDERTYHPIGAEYPGNRAEDIKNPGLGWMTGFLFVVSFLGLFSLALLRKWFFSGIGDSCGFDNFPTFGLTLFKNLFYFDFSPTYIGCGLICLHIVNCSVLLGAILSWDFPWPFISAQYMLGTASLVGSNGGVMAGLAACGVMMSIVSTAADLMQDFKTGYLTLSSAKSMFVSQLLGTAMGCVIAPLTFWLFWTAFDVGSPDGPYKAPYAVIWEMAILGIEGFSELPKRCLALCCGFFMGALIVNLLRDVTPKKIS